jgi:transcription elongation factor
MSPRIATSPSPHTSSSDSSSSRMNSPALSSGGRTLNSNGTEGMETPFASSNNIRRDTTLIGQTIRISQQSFKGYVGIDEDAIESRCKIEFHAKRQTITLDQNRIVTTKYVFFFLFLINRFLIFIEMFLGVKSGHDIRLV